MWSFNIKISANWNTVPSVDSSKSQDCKALTVKPIVTQLTFCSSTFIMGILTYGQGIGLSGYIQLTFTFHFRCGYNLDNGTKNRI